MKLKKWLIGWSTAGLAAPFAHLAIYFLTGYTLGEGIYVFWPAAMGLMVLERNPPIFTTVCVYAIAIAANPLLYALIGFLLWSVGRGGSPAASVDEGK